MRKFSLIFLIVLTTITTLRSLAHIFLPDGGANSIAGLDVPGAGGNNLIAMFALLVQSLDWGGRILIGLMKPIEVASAPPGEIGSYILWPLCLIALWFSLPKKASEPKS